MPTFVDETARFDGLEATAARIGADIDINRCAALPLVAFSGWLASGKDSVADEVVAQLEVPGWTFEKASVAAPLKDEVTQVCRVAAGCENPDAAALAVADSLGVDADAAALVIAALRGEHDWDRFCELYAAGGHDGWTRTAEMRRALQLWGTEVRRVQEPVYWARKAAESAVAALSRGVIRYYCDCRFPDEVAALQAIGYHVVRLSITRDTQAARLNARDGLAVDPTALTHPSETALDGYTGFDTVVSNDGEFEHTVEAVLAAVR